MPARVQVDRQRRGVDVHRHRPAAMELAQERPREQRAEVPAADQPDGR
jgi:hypothetical protein